MSIGFDEDSVEFARTVNSALDGISAEEISEVNGMVEAGYGSFGRYGGMSFEKRLALYRSSQRGCKG
jgi:hypothetical protein